MSSVSAILIAGPTASGKSALAARIARRVGGIVVNADSMQVYRDLEILTARPKPEQMEGIAHLLYGHIDAAINYSVGAWLADVQDILAHRLPPGRMPVFVGGTGLYFKAMTQGLADIPSVPEEIRAAVRARAQGRSPEDLHAELARHDPATAARLRPSDPQRILRALEVFAATGQSLSAFQRDRQAPLLPGNWLGVFLAPERADLRRSMDGRFDAMLQAGALAEVEALGARRLDPLLPVMRAHGVPHLLRYLSGAIGLDEAARLSKLDTWHYAKRQFTFARHQLTQFGWIAPAQAEEAILKVLSERKR